MHNVDSDRSRATGCCRCAGGRCWRRRMRCSWGVLLLPVLPLDASVGLTFGLAAVAIGRYPSMVLRLRTQPWRFTGGDVRFGTVQMVLGAGLAFAEGPSGPRVPPHPAGGCAGCHLSG